MSRKLTHLSQGAFRKELRHLVESYTQPSTVHSTGHRYGILSYKEVEPLVEKFIEDLNQANAEALRKGWDAHLKDPAFFDLDAPSHIRRRASDRKSLIRLASTLPAGSEERRVILERLK